MVMGREYHRNYSRAYYHERRAECFRLLGGRCAKCGSTEKLEIDHKDRKTKTFALGRLLSFKWATVLEELKKCQILCNPCHIEKSKPEVSASNSGAKNANAKLTQIQADEIRARSKLKETGVSLAAKFGVSDAAISRIIRGIGYK